MRYCRFLLGVFALSAIPCFGGEPSPFDTAVSKLSAIAAQNSNTVQVRLNAIKSIGLIGANSDHSVTTLNWLLSARDTAEFETNVYILQVADALGRIGPPAIEAVPELVKAKGIDPELIPGIRTLAIAAIHAPPKVPEGGSQVEIARRNQVGGFRLAKGGHCCQSQTGSE